MLLLFLLCLLGGTLRDVLANVTLVPDLDQREIRDSHERVARNTQDQKEATRCQNIYEADKQLFHVYGKQWRSDKVPLREGYVLTRGIGAHKLYQKPVKWSEARRICRNEGGSLVVINSLAEESVLLSIMRKENVGRVWVDAHDIFEEGEWTTSSGETLERAGYEKWSMEWPNQPDNYGGQQNCGALIQIGGIDDSECYTPHAYICEIDVY